MNFLISTYPSELTDFFERQVRDDLDQQFGRKLDHKYGSPGREYISGMAVWWSQMISGRGNQMCRVALAAHVPIGALGACVGSHLEVGVEVDPDLRKPDQEVGDEMKD